MGHSSRIRSARRASKPEIIHRNKFMNGLMTPEELHAKLGVNQACRACGAAAVITARVYVLLSDLKTDVKAAMQVAHFPDPIPVAKLKAGDAVCVSNVASCARCKDALLKAMTGRNIPSYAFVDIDYGPGPDRIVVQVPAIGGAIGG